MKLPQYLPSRSHKLVTIFLVMAIAVFLLPAVSGSSSVALGATVRSPLSILTMGDSYSAGNGAGSYSGPAGCYRSTKNYAGNLAALLANAPYNRDSKVDNVACSGAVTADFFTAKDSRLPPQLNSVKNSYDLILLTVGGNDAYFKDIVRYCLVAKTRDGKICDPNLKRAETLIADGTIQKRVENVLTEIGKRSSVNARIVLLGYPILEGDTSFALRSGRGKNAPVIAVGKRLREINGAADRLQAAAVASANLKLDTNKMSFVSVQSTFNGPPYHGLYATRVNSDRWMVQPSIDASYLTTATYYHPKPTGWLEEAKLLLASGVVPTLNAPPSSKFAQVSDARFVDAGISLTFTAPSAPTSGILDFKCQASPDGGTTVYPCNAGGGSQQGIGSSSPGLTPNAIYTNPSFIYIGVGWSISLAAVTAGGLQGFGPWFKIEKNPLEAPIIRRALLGSTDITLTFDVPSAPGLTVRDNICEVSPDGGVTVYRCNGGANGTLGSMGPSSPAKTPNSIYHNPGYFQIKAGWSIRVWSVGSTVDSPRSEWFTIL